MSIEAYGMETFTMGRKLEQFKKRFEEMRYGTTYFGIGRDRDGGNIDNLESDIENEKRKAEELIKKCKETNIYDYTCSTYVIHLNVLLETIEELE